MISNKFITSYFNLSLPKASVDVRPFVKTCVNLFDSYVEASSMAVLAIDTERTVVAVNSLASSALGVSANNLIDRHIGDVLPESPLADISIQNPKSFPKKFKMGSRDFRAERTVIDLHDKPIALISFFQDITTYETVTEQLNHAVKQELFLSDVIEHSYDGIYITDSHGKTIMVNESYERISGLSRDILVGEYMNKLVAEGVLSTSLTEEVVAGKKTVTKTQRNKNNKDVVITGNPIFDENGEVRHVITNVRDITDLVELNTRLEAQSNRVRYFQDQILSKSADENVVCSSPEFDNVLSMASKVSKMDSTALILGETGVGKEIVAQYIHKNSKRADKPYIKINCGAIPPTLLESELFGYVAGAFTGASAKGKPGRFELANKGTLFLDEIGELPLNLQSSLLRVLQDGEVTRIGDSKSRKVDVRIIAATNRDLEAMIAKGTFRSDLYYRLNVISINVPPLRERKSAIPSLAAKTIEELNMKYKADKTLSQRFIDSLTESDWPGNIRELKNFIEKQFVLSDSDIIDTDMPRTYGVNDPSMPADSASSEPQTDSDRIPTYAEAKDLMERELFMRAMEVGKSTYKAASLLEMSQPTFFRKYKKLFPNSTEAES